MGEENENVARLCSLLVDGGTPTLRAVFDSIIPPSSLHGTLHNEKVKSTLRKKNLTKKQWNQLYPANESTPVSSADFDISLLYELLCTHDICGLTPPATGWDNLPDPTDLSREADLARVRCLRRNLYGLLIKAFKSDFNEDWSKISNVLMRLGEPHYKPEIEKLKEKWLDPNDQKCFIKAIEEWENISMTFPMRLIKKLSAKVLSIPKYFGIGSFKSDKSTKEEKNPLPEQSVGDASGKINRTDLGDPALKKGASLEETEKIADNVSKCLKEAIKANTKYHPKKFMAAQDITSAKTDDIFTNLTVYYANKKQVKKEQHQDPKDPLSTGEKLKEYTKRTAGIKVKKMEDIFINMNGKHPKSLLLTGKPGIGKSTFCDKVIRDWAMDRLFQNEDAPDVKFAYLLKFRQLSSFGDKEMNLQELLNCSPILDENSRIDDLLFEYLTKNSSKVMIILDGFNECLPHHREIIASDFEERYSNDSRTKMPIPALCSKLIRGKILRDSVVLVSSRPGMVEELDKFEFDRYVEIGGLSPEQVTEYVDNYFSEPENEQMKRLVREHIEKNENLFSFCHIPLLCFLFCWCLEWRITQSGITENLPAKITDLYDEVVVVLVTKLHANLKYLQMSENTMKIAREMLDKLATLGANLLKESKYIFDEEDMKKLNFTEEETENLQVSSLLQCVRVSAFKTKTEMKFIHRTLIEFFAASFFVKNKVIPKKNEASGQTRVFMSGLMSREKDGELMEKLIQQIAPEKYKYDDVNRLLMLQCLYEYGEDELTKRAINYLYDVYCDGDGRIGFYGVTDVDTIYLSYLLDIIHLLKEQHPQPLRGYTLYIRDSSLTSFGVGVVCDSLVRNSFITGLKLTSCSLDDKCVEKITDSLVKTGTTHLDLMENEITDEGVKSICSVLTQTNITHLDLEDNYITDEGAESICRVIIQDDCHVTWLDLSYNKKITEKCKKRVEQLVRKHGVYFGVDIGAKNKEVLRIVKEDEQDKESIEFDPDYEKRVTSPMVSGMKELAICYKQDEASIELTQEGFFWDISKYGALLEFPPNSVGSPTQVVCKACSRESIPSPEADVMETLVSHLVQLGPSSVELQEPVIVILLHAGPGKKSGYETIVKAFDDEERIWKEINEFTDTSHIPKNYKAENVIQVKISKLTSLAVISRLITDTFEVTPAGCVVRSSVCDDVTVTFPERAVDKTISGSMKLVLLPKMILLFNGFGDTKFSEPVIVKFPYRGSTEDLPGNLRVMFQKGPVRPNEPWNEVTGNVRLEKKDSVFLEFHVQHFCRLTVSEPTSCWWRSPQQVFLGVFKKDKESTKLTIACASILANCEEDINNQGYESLAVTTGAVMTHEQVARVELRDGLDIRAMENVSVKFNERETNLAELEYSINKDYCQNHATSRELTSHVYLYFYPDTEYVDANWICRLAVDRRKLYPTEESMDVDPTEESMDIDPTCTQESMDIDPEPENSFIKATCLKDIPPRHGPFSEEFVYTMTSSPRGMSYIINMNRFNVRNPFHKMYGRLGERLGSESDVESLSRLFEGLHFEVQTFWDLFKNGLTAEIKRIAETDFTSYDCLVIFIMSHGKDNYIYASDGEEVHLKKEIFDEFKNSKCKTLKGKPKLFFIQACRKTVPEPVVMLHRNQPEEQAENEQEYKAWCDEIPKNCDEYYDNLYAYSCYEGQVSYRLPLRGTFYVQSIVDVFKEHSCSEHVLSMLTIVKRRVSERQMPKPEDTLTKWVYFWPGLKF